MKQPGAELDAELAELMGKRICRNVDCEGCDSNGGYLVRSADPGETWWEGTTPYSTDIGAAISAAEEMRKAGRIKGWEVNRGPEFAGVEPCAAPVWYVGPLNGELALHRLGRVGNSPAHALTLAILSALKGPA